MNTIARIWAEADERYQAVVAERDALAARVAELERERDAWSDEAAKQLKIRNSLASALESQTGIPASVLIDAHRDKAGAAAVASPREPQP